jgi:carbon starvation protein
MSAILLMASVLIVLILAYRFYGRMMESFWGADPLRPTPAITQNDNVDYVPAKNWLVLFGHHFSSIAGAGPVVGPIMACLVWGWAPALCWVVLGSIFLGGIHDYGALMVSIREKGVSVGDIASSTISKKAKLIFSIFIWLTLILVVAVFAYLAANTFANEPKIVVPSLGLIPVAFIVGIALYRLKYPLTLTTILGLSALVGLIFLGNILPVDLGANAQTLWVIVLLIYCFSASIIPVNYLLQPRDYLSSFLLFGGIFLGLAGILITHPATKTPALILDNNSQGSLWPMMFITVACGAISGFHSLISSGTTSKQIVSEADAKKIGFGAMLVEGFLAAMVIIIFSSSFSLPAFHAHQIMNTNPIALFAESFGNATKTFLGPWGTFIALLILNAFILTTLDSATRIARYITEEILGIKNRFLSTLAVVFCAGSLALAHDGGGLPLWKKIWPVFGAANQLVGALALIVIACWLLQKNKSGFFYVFIPALFMLLTSLTALIIKIPAQWRNQEFLLVIISTILIITTLLLIFEVFFILNNRRRHG